MEHLPDIQLFHWQKDLKKGGKITTIESNPELKEIICKYIIKADLEDQVKLLIGDARKLIPALPNHFDLVFIDADKEQYLDYYHLVFDKVKSNGFILADNALWDGKVVDSNQKNSKETKGILSFNEFIQQDQRVENSLLSIRDGLMLIRKI